MNRFFAFFSQAREKGLAVVRIIVGALMIYHGQEVFDADLMSSYLEWDVFKFPQARLMVYMGKSTEFVAGVSLFLGLFTRVGAFLTLGALSYVTFFVGGGRFWYEDQHPFLFALFGLLFLFTGPGAWSIDHLIFPNSKR
jgi:putative oxidoreductase